MFDNPTSRIGFKELMQGTRNFSSENVISTNSTGTLYKATFNDGSSVAIRRLRVTSHNDKAFRTEMEALGNLKHRNLVPLLGYCVAAGERLLVYQHMPAGSLWERLHCGFEKLPWADRVKVATGAARGLAFLHHSCNPRVLHRNVNAKAILLEDDNEPRITDFGLARLTNPHDTHVSCSLEFSIKNVFLISFPASVWQQPQLVVGRNNRLSKS
jgi:serine/threonine protein kinase